MDHKLVYDPYMPHVSRYKLSEKIEENLINTLDLLLTKLTKQEEVSGFLIALLTPTERIMLAKRLAVVILLKHGFSESHISQTLNVTRVTVSRMQLFLEARGQGFIPAFHILDTEEQLKTLKILITELATYTINAAGGHIKTKIL